LINLFDKSKGELNEQEQTQLRELLCEFEDVFAKSEFDLGKFNTIQHGIDTGANRPVKQRIRRTPLGPIWNTIHSQLKCQDTRPLGAMGTHP
jgi:hypothetical protein